MPRKSTGAPIMSLEKLVTGLPASEYVLNVTIVYDDTHTRSWAADVYQRVENVAGPQTVRGTWWKLSDFSEPGVLAGAVSTAIRSDMIVLAVQSSEGLPLPFYYWVNSWLPHRMQGTGALIALLGAPFPRNAESGRLQKYLRTVGRRARMDVLVTERTDLAAIQLA